MYSFSSLLRFGYCGSFKHGLFSERADTSVDCNCLIEQSIARLSTVSDQTLLSHDFGQFEGTNIGTGCGRHKFLLSSSVFERYYSSVC